MQANLSPSVNIIRDAERPFPYMETANSHLIFEQIASAFKSGVRTFSIVGSYGTGKSAFLLALMQHFSNPEKSKKFEPINGQFNGLKKFEFISIIGENRSFQDVLADKLGVESERKSVFTALKKKRDTLKKEQKCCIIIADEFGKFLEYATANDPSVQIYFLQELAEFVNDPDKNFLFLTTLHKNFDAYSVGESEKKEWEKVKGRFKELTFNEPVEQLLRLASKFIESQKHPDKPKVEGGLLNAIESAGVFRLQTELTEDFAKRIYPFDVLSAMTLTVALQRYGQNERSLFSFLTTEEYLGLNHFRKDKGDNPYLNLAWVFDYLTYNFSSSITSKHNNNDFFQWVTLRKTIERVYTTFAERVGDLLKLVKSIGLLDILGSDGAKIDTAFLQKYGELALGIKDVTPLIYELESKKIIIYQSFKKRFKLFEGTDENIEQLLAKERDKVQLSESLIPELKKYVTEQYHVAKAVSFKTGTPRVFEVKISDKPISNFNEKNNEIDGFINLVFSNQMFDFSEIGKSEPILYGIYKNYENLRQKIKEIQATKKAIDYVGAKGDTVAKEEMESWLSYHLRDLNETINVQLFGEIGNVNWYYECQEIDIQNKKAHNQVLSKICETVYYATPQYRNELINKVSYSSNINAARKNFLTDLFEKSPDTNFGYDDALMPPEKMVYLTLCKHTKLFDTEGGDFICQEPMGNPSFKYLWDTSIAFLDSTKSGKRPLSELIEKLYEKPFRLKNGLVDFWIIAFLRGHRDDMAIFKNGVYVPKVGGDTAELFFREAKNYEVKKFNIDGVRLQLFNKYRELTKQTHQGTITDSSFQETAKPFVVFYNKLSKYTQETKSVSQDCLAFAKTIRSAKDLEKLFFEDLPIAFGTNIDRLNESEDHLNEFVNRINTSIAELRQAYDNLIERIEDKILRIFGFEKQGFEIYLAAIQNRYSAIKGHLLYARQKSFLSRVKLPLDDRESWINSLAQVILSKQLKEFTDEEEIVLYERLADAFKELDDALTLNTMTFDSEKQQALTIEITGSDIVKVKKNVILNKKQKEEVKDFEKKIKKILKDASPSVFDAVLIGLLNKQHNDKD
jgi:hypothetical protein